MNRKTRTNYEKRWFILAKINPLDYKDSKEFNNANKHNITNSTFAAYKRIWRALGLKTINEIKTLEIMPSKVKQLKVKPIKSKKVKIKEKKAKIKFIMKPIDELKPEIEADFYIVNKILIKSKKKKESVINIIKIVEINIIKHEKIVSFYLKFHQPISELFIREPIPKSLKIIKKLPESMQITSEIKNNKKIQIWNIIPELAKNTFKFGYICSGDISKEDFPIEIHILGMEISSAIEKISEPQNTIIFLPELHQQTQTQKNI